MCYVLDKSKHFKTEYFKGILVDTIELKIWDPMKWKVTFRRRGKRHLSFIFWVLQSANYPLVLILLFYHIEFWLLMCSVRNCCMWILPSSCHEVFLSSKNLVYVVIVWFSGELFHLNKLGESKFCKRHGDNMLIKAVKLKTCL